MADEATGGEAKAGQSVKEKYDLQGKALNQGEIDNVVEKYRKMRKKK